MSFSIFSIIARLRSLWRGLFHRANVEAEMTEEFRHHLELRTEDLIRRGLSPEVAARRARIEFGHIDSHKSDARASRGLRLFDEIRFSALDVKLGLRMLRKYPGLSLVSLIGLSVAIAIGAGAFGFISSLLDPALPLDEGDRVVSLQNSNIRNPGNPDRQSVHDFLMWRDELTSITDLSAFMNDSRNLVIPGGGVELVRVALMTASGFRVARVAPLLGRPLIVDDEREGAPAVVVIAHEEWQRRFGGDSAVVGREVRLGSTVHTVVGVMPEGFRFPVNDRYWVPLRLDPGDYERGGGPALVMFGRLAEGVTLRGAQVELATIGLRSAALYPETHQHLRPRVLPYTYDYVDIDSPAMAWAMRAFQLAISLLLVVIAVNVAILTYARTTTRAGEIAVRTALGASRKRIVTQLFAEALVLSGTAAVIGLLIASVALTEIQAFQEREGNLPFWLELGLSPRLIAYVVALALTAGVIVGVFPALKATGRHVYSGLQRLSSLGSGMQLGRTWTAMIVTQVAVAVAVVPYAGYAAVVSVRRATANSGYPAEQYLRASLSMERVEAPPSAEQDAYDHAFAARFHDRAAELFRRLEADPAVAGVTYATGFPGGGGYGRFEIEPASWDSVRQNRMYRSVRTNDVDVDFFGTFDVSTLAGRTFDEGDVRDGANTVIVDQVFANQVLGNADVLGRRVRSVSRSRETGEIEPGPWLEIVGVVPDFTVQYDFDPADPKLYRPVALAEAPTILALSVRIRDGSARAFAPRLRGITAAVDPTLQLHELRTVADFQRSAQQGLLALSLVIVAVTGSVLLLSAAGIYAMMSFIVARRRREIGIRSALGAEPRRLLSGIFARASAQLSAGVFLGLVLAGVVDRSLGGGPLEGTGVLLLPMVAVLMTAIGLLATFGPARRVLAIQPTEALREE